MKNGQKTVPLEKKSAFKCTLEVLYAYPKLKVAASLNPDAERTRKFVELIDEALKQLYTDPYYELIELIFWKHESREQIAEKYNVDARTITRNKNRLVNEIKIIIFSDDVIQELFM